MPLGDAPNYSTPRTLGLALVSILGSLGHFALGALDYGNVSRYLGLWGMLLAGLLLVFGILSLIRYAEAHDAMTDPHPRTPMYSTPHQSLTFAIGLSLNALCALTALAWAGSGQLVPWHLAAAAVNLWAVWLAWQARPGRSED